MTNQITVRLKNNYQCHISGFVLYFNNVATHNGYFNTITDLRKFWNDYRPMIAAGFIYTLPEASWHKP